MVTKDTVLRLKATGKAVPKKVFLKLLLIKKEDAYYQVPKDSLYYRAESYRILIRGFEEEKSRMEKRLESLEPPDLTKSFDRYGDDVEKAIVKEEEIEKVWSESINPLSSEKRMMIDERVRNRMEREFDKKQKQEEKKYQSTKKQMQEIIEIRDKQIEVFEGYVQEEENKIQDKLVSLVSDGTIDAVMKKEGEMAQRVEMKYEALTKYFSPEEVSDFIIKDALKVSAEIKATKTQPSNPPISGGLGLK
jgi:hypothetical protein